MPSPSSPVARLAALPPTALLAAILLVAMLLGGVGTRGATADEDADARRERMRRAQTEFEAEEKAFVERVNAAIDRGRDWLVKQQTAEGHWPTWKPNTLDKVYPGRAALIMLTLAKCGLELKDRDKVLQRGLTALEGYRSYLASKAPGTTAEGEHTYSNAILVMMYEALYAQHPKPGKGRPRRKPRKPKKNPCKLPKDVIRTMQDLIGRIEATQAEQVWRYPGPGESDQDLSNTQYALLALQSAGRCGMEVSAEVYRRALGYLLENQARSGPQVKLWMDNPAWSPGEERYGRLIPAGKARARGWGYMPGSTHTGSMTTAGIASLAIVKERLRDLEVLEPEERKRIDEALRDGVGWFSKRFAVDRNPGNQSWHYYYLYGLERAGDLLGLRYFGEHDWYREGAEYLIGAQQAGGSWPGQGGGDPNAHGETELNRTCFALLFLKRATMPPSVPLGPVVTGD